MSALPVQSQKLVPAQVGFLAIYNPSLGNTDETLDDQIVYYSSPESRHRNRRRRRTSRDSPAKSSQEEKNERLRKIGLAQGMVEFGKDFSEGKPVDTIETEKSRIILHELEPGWWLIAVCVPISQVIPSYH
jgi:First Longin domain of INTU, CCZ1 and HPS4